MNGLPDIATNRPGATARGGTVTTDAGEWLVRHREGDGCAFAEIVRQYRAPVYSYLIRCAVAPADRDDLFQDIFIRVHRAAGDYRPDLPLHPWLFTIVANAVRTYHRRQRVHRLVHSDDTERAPADPAADGETVAMARQTVGWLEGALVTLPPLQREALLLTSVEGLPQKTAARALGLPLNTLKTHVRRARLALLALLESRNRPIAGEDSP